MRAEAAKVDVSDSLSATIGEWHDGNVGVGNATTAPIDYSCLLSFLMISRNTFASRPNCTLCQTSPDGTTWGMPTPEMLRCSASISCEACANWSQVMIACR